MKYDIVRQASGEVVGTFESLTSKTGVFIWNRHEPKDFDYVCIVQVIDEGQLIETHLK